MANTQQVLSLYEEPMWESIERQRLSLPKCAHCGTFRYPPGPVCADCNALEYDWTEISGGGKILSWVIFHRQYFDDYPAPYNVVAIRLDEGPILISNLVGREPEGSWIDQPVTLTYRRHLNRTQHAFILKNPEIGPLK